MTRLPTVRRNLIALCHAVMLFVLFGVRASLAQGLQENEYASTGDWKVIAVSDSNGFRYCAADRGPTSGRLDIPLRIARDQDGWAIGRHTGGGFKQVRLDIDGEWDNAQLQPVHNDVHAFVSIPPRVQDFLRTKRTLTLTIDGEDYRYPLRGANQAMRRIAECVQNRGVAQNAPQPAPKQQAANTPPQNTNAGNCPGGEKRLTLSGLCPADAATTFLPKLQLNKDLQLFQGCKTWINETEMPGLTGPDIVLYGAIRCKDWIASLEFGGGARSAELIALPRDGGSPDVKITLINPEPDGVTAINRWAGDVLREELRKEKKKASHKCSARKNPNGPGLIYAVDEKTAKRLEANEPMSSINICGSYGERDDPSHWRVFAGLAWYFQLPQDAESTIDSNNLVVLERDTNAPKGWKIRK